MEAFSFLKDKVKKKLEGWREKTLSAAGKEVLLKAVIQSIPTYVMGCFEVPRVLCYEIQQLMARFWWGASEESKKIHWIAWEGLCCPKNEGGLGFRNLHHFNLSLLAKQGWRILQQPADTLLARILKAHYFPTTAFLESTSRGGESYTWRSILAGKDVLKKGVRFQIGDGRSVNVWRDPWLPMPHSFRPFSPVVEGLEELKVSELIDQENKDWLLPMLDVLFSREEAALIACIPLSIFIIQRIGDYGILIRKEFSALRVLIEWLDGVDNYPKRLLLQALLVLKMIEKHLFMGCTVSNRFWNLSPLQLRDLDSPTLPFKEWLCSAFDYLTKQHLDIFFLCLWALWTERNNIIWKGSAFDPGVTVGWALRHLEEYHRLHLRQGRSSRRTPTSWRCPPSGRLKINVDGAFKSETGVGGIGVVARNVFGECVAAMARHFPYVSSAIHMEAEACRAGLLLAIHQGWAEVEIESDCATLVTALNVSTMDLSDIDRIIDDCRDYRTTFNSIHIRYIYQEANGVRGYV